MPSCSPPSPPGWGPPLRPLLCLQHRAERGTNVRLWDHRRGCSVSAPPPPTPAAPRCGAVLRLLGGRSLRCLCAGPRAGLGSGGLSLSIGDGLGNLTLFLFLVCAHRALARLPSGSLDFFNHALGIRSPGPLLCTSGELGVWRQLTVSVKFPYLPSVLCFQ